MQNVNSQDPLAVDVTEAIRAGDLPALRQLLADHPGLATARISEDCGSGKQSRSLLHIATDWPGHFPNGPRVIATLVAAGADPNARFTGPHTESPLHWAASSSDVPVLDALIAVGADIEAPGAVISGGTPLTDARAFGQWRAAHRLIEHGAHATLQDAAPSACSIACRRTSTPPNHPPATRSPAPSGAPATVATSPPPSTCTSRAPTLTGSATTT
ncbi:ankyrin repeat domain-containing protein [Streptomyces sp. NPDC002659]|uniref:ankyrin repeat domain-containing protein n=1 Tax=Streptomyces sp. NPDC002659 TaxID=3364656 RepID=UPI0036B2EB3B